MYDIHEDHPTENATHRANEAGSEVEGQGSNASKKIRLLQLPDL